MFLVFSEVLSHSASKGGFLEAFSEKSSSLKSGDFVLRERRCERDGIQPATASLCLWVGVGAVYANFNYLSLQECVYVCVGGQCDRGLTLPSCRMGPRRHLKEGGLCWNTAL